MACSACEGKRFLIVNVNNTRRLRIERCDECSADTLTDRDVQTWTALAALESARDEQRRTDPVTGLLKKEKR